MRAILAGILILLSARLTHAEIVIHSGEKVAFLGDSITAQGWTSAHGYVRLVVSGLEVEGVKVVPVPAGVGGNRSNDMLARLKRDVLDKKPDWVTVSCGMNDVIAGAKGVPLDQFKANMTQLVEQCQAVPIKVILLTTTLCGKHDSPSSRTLCEYSDFLRELAKQKKCLLVDLYPLFVESVRSSTPLRGLTYDGVHMMPEGNVLIARTMLAALGCTETRIAKANEGWLDLPDAGSFSTRVDVELNKKFFTASVHLTLRQRERLLEAAEAAKKPTLMHWSKDLLLSLMKKKVQPTGPYDSLDALFVPAEREKVQAELQSEFEAEIARIVEGRQR
jgi:lysophospholipase L1-like esterase